ncbi:MAG: diacylglycerol kinase [Cyanobacteria bacterium SZAS LIN-3]|nr:diacylglycerol kinase [Cyanobacteria bacterium SZAS LIN-3]
MADDGTFKGHGGKPGRKSTVISMSAHKNRHGHSSSAEAEKDAPKKLAGLTVFEALPCEDSPFERDVELTDAELLAAAVQEPAPVKGRGRRFLRWGLDESQPTEVFSDDDCDGEVAEALASGSRDAAKSRGDDWDHKTGRSGSVTESFYHAIHGLKSGFAGQRNVRIHCVISVMVFLLAFLLQVDYAGCLSLILATGFVFFAEYVNTALEHITDIQAHFRHHESARLAKDTAAGAVLIAAVTAVLVGLTVFAPRLFALLIGQT